MDASCGSTIPIAILNWYSLSNHTEFQYEQMTCSMAISIKQNLSISWSDFALAGEVTYRTDGRKLIDQLLNKTRSAIESLATKCFTNLNEIIINNIQQTQYLSKTIIDKLLYIFLRKTIDFYYTYCKSDRRLIKIRMYLCFYYFARRYCIPVFFFQKVNWSQQSGSQPWYLPFQKCKHLWERNYKVDI